MSVAKVPSSRPPSCLSDPRRQTIGPEGAGRTLADRVLIHQTHVPAGPLDRRGPPCQARSGDISPRGSGWPPADVDVWAQLDAKPRKRRHARGIPELFGNRARSEPHSPPERQRKQPGYGNPGLESSVIDSSLESATEETVDRGDRASGPQIPRRSVWRPDRLCEGEPRAIFSLDPNKSVAVVGFTRSILSPPSSGLSSSSSCNSCKPTKRRMTGPAICRFGARRPSYSAAKARSATSLQSSRGAEIHLCRRH
jgi:hypothetical protein